MHRRTFTRVAPMRARICFYACIAVALFLTWRLYDVQALKGPVYAKEALAQRSDTVEVFARRGSILDRYGNVLVRSLPSESIYAVPRELADADDTVRKLQRIFGRLDPAVVSALHDRHGWFVWIARKVSHETAARVRALAQLGIEIKEEDTGLRVDTAGRLASDVVGFVGTDENGLDGVEYAYDDVLRGRSGRITLETDEFGRPIPFGRERVITPAQPGNNVQLTIDPYVQFVAERALAAQMRAYRALDGCAIVMDPWTGSVLAMASAPDFDPNRFWAYSPAARRDGCVLDAYEPGSTFKLVTAAAALESRRIGLQTRFAERDAIEVGGGTIHNADDGFTAGSSGTETLGDIITYSHNVGAAEVALDVGAKTFYAMERRAGFGSPTQIGLPGENPGIAPPPAVWSGSSLATMAFGQGVSVTPLAMARFYCAIANGGLLMQPQMMRRRLRSKASSCTAINAAGRASRLFAKNRDGAEVIFTFGRPARYRPRHRPHPRLRNGRKNGHGSDGRERRIPRRLLRSFVHRHGALSEGAVRYLL